MFVKSVQYLFKRMFLFTYMYHIILYIPLYTKYQFNLFSNECSWRIFCSGRWALVERNSYHRLNPHKIKIKLKCEFCSYFTQVSTVSNCLIVWIWKKETHAHKNESARWISSIYIHSVLIFLTKSNCYHNQYYV